MFVIEIRANYETSPDSARVLFPKEELQIGWENSIYKWNVGAGFRNIGNTCYLNSTIQALFHVSSIANWLRSDRLHRENCLSRRHCIVCAMALTLKRSQAMDEAFPPRLICLNLNLIAKDFTIGRQEDAHEFLGLLIEAMDTSFLGRFPDHKSFDHQIKETTPVNQIFGGCVQTTVKCQHCGNASTTKQNIGQLSLDINESDTIEEALDSYFKCETIEEYKCGSCNTIATATKNYTLDRAPISLCIQLKWFTYDGGKIKKDVKLKPTLQLSKYSCKWNETSWNYRLVSMIIHSGYSQNYGHYTAVGLSEDKNFYKFDDDLVAPISVYNAMNSNPYVIFYEIC